MLCLVAVAALAAALLSLAQLFHPSHDALAAFDRSRESQSQESPGRRGARGPGEKQMPAPLPPAALCPEPVHIAMVVVGVNATRSTVVVLKSLLAQRSMPLELHFLSDAVSEARLAQVLQSWRLEAVRVHYYDVQRFTASVAWVPTLHASGVFGLAKLVYAQALEGVERVIALDTDLVLTRDLGTLWAHFASFRPQHLMAVAPQQSGWYLHEMEDSRGGEHLVWPARGRGLNSGVMLLHLARMRSQGWDALWPPLTQAQLRIAGKTTLADQDVFNLVHVHRPEVVYILPCWWNIQLHAHTTAASCLAANAPGILHWNSPQKMEADYPFRDKFRAVYRAIVGSDSYALRLLPWPCASVHAPLLSDERNPPTQAEPGSSDHPPHCPPPAPPLRVHPDYYVLQLKPGFFTCTAVGQLASRAPAGELLVKARGEALAQQRFLRHLQQTHVLNVQAASEATAGNVKCWPSLSPAQRAAAAAAAADKLADDPPPPAGAEDARLAAHVEAEAPPVDVTLVVHVDMSRLHVLPDLLAKWTGPASIAIFLQDGDVPRLHDLADAGQLFNGAEHEIRIHLAIDDGNQRGYPVNLLRNLGWRAVRTSHVFMLDADFLPGPQLYSTLRAGLLSRGWMAPGHDSQRVALVVPAFETSDYAIKMPEASGASALRALYNEGRVSVFRAQEWPAGHRATGYNSWWTAVQPYAIEWEEGYEPYVVLPFTAPRYVTLTRILWRGWVEGGQGREV
jgi:lipopolysaccharide biosynthesis glycosyltransferase